MTLTFADVRGAGANNDEYVVKSAINQQYIASSRNIVAAEGTSEN
jgi:hypothetical protein